MDKKIIVRTLIGIFIGGFLGFFISLLNRYFCITGSCPLTKNMFISIIYGVLVGVFIALSR
ncbi:MAG: DUF6132 family protein [Endomicrobia bacterium]|nr:DUF6132 family protein [Endomicrobiia bacterium]